MRQKKLPTVDFFRLRAEAGAVLAKNGNRLTLILACMIAASPLMLYVSAISAVRLIAASFFSNLQWFRFAASAAIALLLTQLITLPLWMGLLRIASVIEDGQEPSLTLLFDAFRSRSKYKTAQRASFSILWRAALLILTEVGASSLINALFQGTAEVILWGIPLYLSVFLIWFSLTVRGFLIPYLSWQIPDAAMRMQPYAASLGKHYWMGFFPWIVLSLMTFGVLFLADTLPRMLIAYFRLCNKLNEFTTQSEEMIK